MKSAALVAVDANGPAFRAALIKAWDAGDAVLPLDPRMSDAERRSLLTRMRPGRLVNSEGESVLPGGAPVEDGVAVVVMTSGSSGPAKGVELTHDALRASFERMSQRTGISSSDRWLCCLPLSHIAGLSVVVRSIYAENEPVMHEGFDPHAVALESSASVLPVVPTMLERILDLGLDLSRYRWMIVGGGPVSAALLQRAASAVVRVTTTYGATETSGGCVYDDVALDDVRVRIAGGGEVQVRGPVLFSRYRLDPEATSAAFDDGWLRMPDLGEIGPDGKLTVIGRGDDVIVTGGEKVIPQEVEGVLMDHPAVREVVVVGVPDETWGHSVIAVIVPEGDPPSLAELRDFVGSRLARYKAPRRVVFVESLPRGPLGKPIRRDVTGLALGAR